MSILTNYRKAIYIGLGILLGLAIAFIVFTLVNSQKLKTTIADQESEIVSLKQKSDSLLLKIRTDEQQLIEIANKLKDTLSTLEPVKGPTEESLWNKVRDQNSFESVLDFIRSKENKGSYQNDALSKLMELGKTGWLYAGRSSDNKSYSEDQIARVLWRKNDYDIQNNLTPKIGDLIMLSGTQGRRTYANSSPREGQNGIWQANTIAYVSEIKKEGATALIIKIIYE